MIIRIIRQNNITLKNVLLNVNNCLYLTEVKNTVHYRCENNN